MIRIKSTRSYIVSRSTCCKTSLITDSDRAEQTVTKNGKQKLFFLFLKKNKNTIVDLLIKFPEFLILHVFFSYDPTGIPGSRDPRGDVRPVPRWVF